jgi:23S rRNA pseudouridine1911/1915/1917 synthase
MIICQRKIGNSCVSKRISDYVLEEFCNYLPSKSSVKKAFKKGLILLNGKVSDTGVWLSENDVIVLLEDESYKQKPFLLTLTILFEDEHIAVINKPAGYPVNGNFHKTIQNALSYNLKISTLVDALKVPRPVHRLDKLTSGILLIAKTKRAQISLGNQFENHGVSKTYYALVKGKLEGNGEFDSAIEGLPSFTSYKSVHIEKSLTYRWVSLVKLMPYTGRTHQLRVHLAKSGHPIIGDYIHDDDKVLKGKGLFLSACEIQFMHPISTKTIALKITIPSKFYSLFEREKRRWEKFNL